MLFRSNKGTYKVIVAFNVYPTKNDKGEVVHRFPVQKQCNYVSGDLCYETLQADLQRNLEIAKKVLRTDNIVFVE